MTMSGLFGEAKLFATIADEWDMFLRLKHPGAIRYFKMDEACQLDGEFKHWKEENRDAKVGVNPARNAPGHASLNLQPARALGSSPRQDVHRLASILKDPDIGGFDDVTDLLDPSSIDASVAIQTFAAQARLDDLILLYFSGHGVKDQNGRLFLAVKRAFPQCCLETH